MWYKRHNKSINWKNHFLSKITSIYVLDLRTSIRKNAFFFFTDEFQYRSRCQRYHSFQFISSAFWPSSTTVHQIDCPFGCDISEWFERFDEKNLTSVFICHGKNELGATVRYPFLRVIVISNAKTLLLLQPQKKSPSIQSPGTIPAVTLWAETAAQFILKSPKFHPTDIIRYFGEISSIWSDNRSSRRWLQL